MDAPDSINKAGTESKTLSPQSERASSPANSPYRVSLVKREVEDTQRKLPRSLSSPKASNAVKSSSQPNSPRAPISTTAPVTTTSTTSTTAVLTTTTTSTTTVGGMTSPASTSTSRHALGNITPLASPESRLEPSSPGSPSRMRSESSPGRIHSPEWQADINQRLQIALTVARKESTRVLAQFHTVDAPPYPDAASEWINAESFARLPLPAKVMIIGFCAVKKLFGKGQAIFGKEWAWTRGGDGPLRNWGQRGLTKRNEENECEYFTGQKAFEAAYLNGCLEQLFDQLLEEISGIAPGHKRDIEITKLAKQGDHVLNLALESLRALTHRTDVPPDLLKQFWLAMVEDKPSDIQKGLLNIYFGQANCIAVQAFLNAFMWLAETVGKCLRPQTGLIEILKTFYFFAPHLLSLPYNDFLLAMAKLVTDEETQALKRMGLDEKQLATLLATAKKKLNKELNIELAAHKVEKHAENARNATFKAINKKSMELVFKLAQGDLRFQQDGILMITDAPIVRGQAASTPRPVQAAPSSTQVAPVTQSAKADEEELSGSTLEADD